jgi:hypothetical protein
MSKIKVHSLTELLVDAQSFPGGQAKPWGSGRGQG